MKKVYMANNGAILADTTAQQIVDALLHMPLMDNMPTERALEATHVDVFTEQECLAEERTVLEVREHGF